MGNIKLDSHELFCCCFVIKTFTILFLSVFLLKDIFSNAYCQFINRELMPTAQGLQI